MAHLYPLRFAPQYMERIWGGQNLEALPGRDLRGMTRCGESWEISGLPGSESIVTNGFLAGNSLNEVLEVYMGDLVGESVFEKFGEYFPILIKLIDAREDLSIQVHPPDLIAMERHESPGKTEMWYVMKAEPGARLITGFNRNLTQDQFLEALANKELPGICQLVPVQKGDVCFIPAGRIHAIGAGILLAEIQQASDITYRVYDWDRLDPQGRSRDLHLEDALSVMEMEGPTDPLVTYKSRRDAAISLVACPYFETNLLDLNQPMARDSVLIDSFVIYLVMEGCVRIEGATFATEVLDTGQTALIPASVDAYRLVPQGQARLLEVLMPSKLPEK